MQPSIIGFSLEGASNALCPRQRWPGGDAVNDFTIDGSASVRDPIAFGNALEILWTLQNMATRLNHHHIYMLDFQRIYTSIYPHQFSSC
jgi:hypothetical protein